MKNILFLTFFSLMTLGQVATASSNENNYLMENQGHIVTRSEEFMSYYNQHAQRTPLLADLESYFDIPAFVQDFLKYNDTPSNPYMMQLVIKACSTSIIAKNYPYQGDYELVERLAPIFWQFNKLARAT